jgi:hypothetical protein
MSATGYRAAFRLLGAPAIWLLQFSVLYGPKAFVCSRNLAEHYPGFAGVMSAVAACAILAIMLAPLRGTQGDRLFLDRASLAIGLLSLCAVVWTCLPVLLLPACAGPG